jgi:methylase of polypeptide subunit release factors
VPAVRATATGEPRATLTRLFVLQQPVDAAAAGAALPDLERLTAAGLLASDENGEVRARLDVRPYAADDVDLFVVSDLGSGIGGNSGPVRPDHVLGVGGASTTLAQLTVRLPVGRALDLGTGCGVQALHLAAHADHVVATDRNPRALAMARLTAGLSEVDLDLRRGSLFEPVAGETFDLVVSNPPFVVSPSTRFAYRDPELPGDELCRLVVGQAPASLADGGWAQLLASWLHVEGADWRERVAGWVVPTGCDAWVVQREVLDPTEHVELWLRDSGDAGTPAYGQLYDEWLDWFEEHRVEGVGFGWVVLRRSGSADPYVRIEDVRQQVAQPLGPAVVDWFARHDWLRATPDRDLLAARLMVASDVALEITAAQGDGGGFRETGRRLRQAAGLRREGSLDAVGAAVVGRCDGRRALGDVLDEVAAEHGLPAEDLRVGALGAVRTLVEEGFLRPAESAASV